jgi:hypothetical protein
MVRITLFFAFYYTLFVYWKRYASPPQHTVAHASRFVSSLHAVLAVGLAGSYLAGYLSNDSWDELSAVSMGYILHDIFIIFGTELYHKTGSDMILHHGLFLYFVWRYHSVLRIEMAFGYLSESSTLFLNLAWFGYSSGNLDSLSYRLNGLMTLVFFFIFRVLVFPHLALRAIFQGEYFGSILVLILTTLNYRWFWLLCQKI